MTIKEKVEKVAYLMQLNAPSHSLAAGLRYWSSPETQARKSRLLTLPENEIDQLCLSEFHAKREQIEQWRFYSQPNAQANFQRFEKLDYWCPDEAVALLLGRNPDLVSWGTLKNFQNDDEAAEAALSNLGVHTANLFTGRYLVSQYLDLALMVSRAKVFINGNLRIDPVSLLNWATQNATPVPAPLKAVLQGREAQQVQALSNPIAIADNSNIPQAAQTLPADTATAPVVEVLMEAGPGWTLKPSLKRSPAYRWPLYQVLKAAHIEGQPCPGPRDVLEVWKLNPPPDIQVMPDGVKYNDALGNPKEANLKAIRQAIKNLLNS